MNSWIQSHLNFHEVSCSNNTKFCHITSKSEQENHYSQWQMLLGWPENVTALKYGNGEKTAGKNHYECHGHEETEKRTSTRPFTFD